MSGALAKGSLPAQTRERIASAAREQTSGVAQVVQAIQALDRDTQQNSALVEQTNAAAESLRQQADMLMEEIAKFRVV